MSFGYQMSTGVVLCPNTMSMFCKTAFCYKLGIINITADVKNHVCVMSSSIPGVTSHLSPQKILLRTEIV